MTAAKTETWFGFIELRVSARYVTAASVNSHKTSGKLSNVCGFGGGLPTGRGHEDEGQVKIGKAALDDILRRYTLNS
jgi:hypothetical protein